MKRKSLVAILLALVLCFTMALTACKDDNDDPPGGGGGTTPTLEQVVEKLQGMPTSTDESAIENALDEEKNNLIETHKESAPASHVIESLGLRFPGYAKSCARGLFGYE